ncbi:MAG: nitrous oxide reductase family maturation protein NosD [Ignavibacteria bacterium]|nr:nitrous oxide reductase family maturation protein NosD [Ignavibacteria bacterium]
MNRLWSVAGLAVAASLLLGQSAAQNSSLQRRIDAAKSGDTIIVDQGVHEGNLLLQKRLALVGKGKPVIRGDGSGSCITILADSCLVRGFLIERSGGELMREDAGILLKLGRNIIEDNEIRNVLFGIYLFGVDSNRIMNNLIVGRRELEVGQRGSGIHIWNSHGNFFSGNTITDVRDGFYIQYAHHTFIEKSKVFRVRYGLHYMYADSNVFLGNRFYDNVAGAAVMYSKGILMRHNVFAHNRGFASYGILFQDCHGIRADSNVVVDNVVGIFFEGSTGNSFRHNIIAQNDVALQVFQNSVRNTFSGNNFIDNLSPLTIVGKRTESHWSENGRGNYWSSYDGYDIDADGIGDVPMKIQNVFSYLEGRYPNLRLYLYSPASQALAVAAKAFPIIPINEEVDEKPLVRPVDLYVLGANEYGKTSEEVGGSTGTSKGVWFVVPLAVAASLGIFYLRNSKRGAR